MEKTIYPKIIDGNEIYSKLSIIEKYRTKKDAYEIVTGIEPNFFNKISLFFANKTYSQIAKDCISSGEISINPIEISKNEENAKDIYKENKLDTTEKTRVNEFRKSIEVDLSDISELEYETEETETEIEEYLSDIKEPDKTEEIDYKEFFEFSEVPSQEVDLDIENILEEIQQKTKENNSQVTDKDEFEL